jgi:hypothetical protein
MNLHNTAVDKLAEKIIEASFFFAEAFNSELNENLKTEDERKEKYVYIFLQCFYFLMHLNNRTMFAKVGSEILDRFNKEFGPLMICIVIDSILADRSQYLPELEKTADYILEQLNKAEDEYSTSKDLLWDTEKHLDSLTGDSLLSKLTRNIVLHCGYELIEYKPGVKLTRNPLDIMKINLKVSDLFIFIMQDMNFNSLVEQVAEDIR